MQRHTLQELLRSCARLRSIDEGQKVHVLVVKEGLHADPLVGTALVDMYAKCGFTKQARKEFESLLDRDVVAWTALIAGYAEHGACMEALRCLEKMQLEGTSPNAVTYLCILKGFGSARALQIGHKVYADIVNYGFETDLYIGSTLVYFYGKCGFVPEAEAVFKRILGRNEYSWNALIAAYADTKPGQELLNLLDQMQLEGLSPDPVTYVCSLKSCGSAGDIKRGQCIHTEMVKRGLDIAVFAGNSLVDMYMKCGALIEAEDVFKKLPEKTVVAWTALLIGYAEHGFNEKALSCLDQMQCKGLCQDAMTYIGGLKAVINYNDQARGHDVHLQIVTDGFELDLFVGNSLIDFYAQAGLFLEALDVLEELPSRDVISWNALIAGFIEHEAADEALMCLQHMEQDCVSPDDVSLMCSLRACSLIGNTIRGQELHAEIVKKGYDSDLFVGNTLVDMLAKCGLLVEACHSFDRLPVRDVASWTARIDGFCENGFGADALEIFEDMQSNSISPNTATYICCLKASGSIKAISKGQALHARMTKEGLDQYLSLGSSVVDMYAKCGFLLDAQVAFEALSVKDDLSYNALLWGYAEHGYKGEAFDCIESISIDGVVPDIITFGSILKACGTSSAVSFGQDVHCEIIKRGFERDGTVVDLLVDLYAKCGLHAEARSLCNAVTKQNVVSWNMLICGYVEHGDVEEALNCLQQMQIQGLLPDEVTYVSCLKACSSLGSLDNGRGLHTCISEEELEVDLFISNTLVDMYAKCGSLVEAREVFDDLPHKDCVSWNVLVAGYASQGESDHVSDMLKRMRQDGVVPNATTVVSVLTVCNHSGLIYECQQCFEVLNRERVVFFTIEHFNCMVDLLGRAGQLEKVQMLLEQMPFHPNLVTWSSVLSSCKKLGNVDLGMWAFENALCLNQSEA
ncbi:hypothetical protein GOP47_0012020 [Adiantum capillus-veneris]|uniref:Pentatricopeptide repeat-containing protein n=1 Tax=Adiantum capillus-veneris TaxID=13818 RepID=A0A9D4UV34_ADICA|nr:hypothetical protein GOP47_0012020 [Adiantum capillus-veneris]